MPTQSIHKNIADTVAAGILARGLLCYPNDDALPTAQIVVAWGTVGEIQALKLPAIVVSPAGNESASAVFNDRDDVSYPIGVFVVDRHPATERGPIDRYLYWRERIRSKFISQRLGSGGTMYAWNCTYDSSPVVDPNLLQGYELLVAPLFFRFLSREARG